VSRRFIPAAIRVEKETGKQAIKDFLATRIS
jgi:hypothetical protein